MVDLGDLSVDANQDTNVAQSVFEREGILVAKNVLPAALARDVADFPYARRAGASRGA